jgi:chemotaxis protein CheD
MLPEQKNEKDTSFKYGNIAIPEILNRMRAFGSDDANIKAKLFGGSEIGDLQGVFNIGERNVALAQKLLQKEGISIISSSVGGKRGRKVVFHTATGDVFIKYIRSTKMEAEKLV